MQTSFLEQLNLMWWGTGGVPYVRSRHNLNAWSQLRARLNYYTVCICTNWIPQASCAGEVGDLLLPRSNIYHPGVAWPTYSSNGLTRRTDGIDCRALSAQDERIDKTHT